MRPPAPDPETSSMSTPSSRAIRRTDGAAGAGGSLAGAPARRSGSRPRLMSTTFGRPVARRRRLRGPDRAGKAGARSASCSAACGRRWILHAGLVRLARLVLRLHVGLHVGGFRRPPSQPRAWRPAASAGPHLRPPFAASSGFALLLRRGFGLSPAPPSFGRGFGGLRRAASRLRLRAGVLPSSQLGFASAASAPLRRLPPLPRHRPRPSGSPGRP